MPDITVNLEPKNLRTLYETVSNLGRDTQIGINMIFHIYGSRITSDAKTFAPVKTGYLRRSISHIVRELALVVFVGAPYASYQERGTRYIRARNFLRMAVDRHMDDLETEIMFLVSEALKRGEG